MIIKFKLLREYPNRENFSELQVAECTYNNQTINKIMLTLSKESESLIKDGDNKSFIIKNIRDDEIELVTNTLRIKSTSSIIEPIKIDFLFAVDQVKQVNNDWEVELSFIHLWNGEMIKKIHILNTDNQYGKIIEKNKNEYLFQLAKIKKYDTNSLANQATSKILTIFATDFQELNVSVPLQINLREVPVKGLEVLNNNNNTYIFDSREILASKGLKDYEKIELVTNEKINKDEIISFIIPDLRIIFQRDREDKILRVGQAYHSLIKTQITPEVPADEPAKKEIQEFLAKYQNDNYRKRISDCQKKLQKYSVLLNQIHLQPKTQTDYAEKLAKQKNDLSHKLEVFIDQTKLQKRIAILKEQFFLVAQDYQGASQVDWLQQELKKIDQEFSATEKEIEKYNSLENGYLQKNWFLALQNDPQFQQLLIKHNLSQPRVLDNLTWWDFHSCLKGDGSLDYSILETRIQEIKTHLASLNDLGYRLTEISPGEKYEKWNQAQIKKSEAVKAIDLSYSPEQWKDPLYQEYKEINRVFADIIIETLRRKWIPPLTGTQKKEIKNSLGPSLAIDVITRVQKESFVAQFKVYFKDVIDRELKKLSEEEPNELGKLMTYGERMNKSVTWKQLNFHFKQAMTEIQKVRSGKLASIKELKEQAKKNISEILEKSKLKTSDLYSPYQNWSADIEKMESNSKILQFEQDLTLLLEEINCFLQQKCFPNLDSKEKDQIKRVKDTDELEKQIEILLEGKKAWLAIWQTNFYLQNYRELRDENEQNYYLQKRQLEEVDSLLKSVNNLNKEQIELLQDLTNILAGLRYSFSIKCLQQRFNELILQKNVSFREKELVLKELQKIFQERSEENKLNESETVAQAEIEVNFSLIRQGKNAKKLSIFNERQAGLSLLDLPQEASEESETKTGNDSGPFSQQSLILLAFGGLLLIFLWRWYRKKREEDPFW